jgi:threonine/homoserine efflux transporter RhtA
MFVTVTAFAVLCVLSLLYRYRSADHREQNQIKWLLYAAGFFVLNLVLGFLWGELGNQWASLGTALLFLSIMLMPIAIAIAILRYRLYDIDVIIRKTLQYALLTAFLALVYFGSVIFLQSLTENLFGEQSPLVIVLSTLAIAALFNPLRTRIQDFIDRRFYRKKYDAEQALAQFAATVRDEVDMQKLSAWLLELVEESMQPEKTSLWLKK